MKELRYTLIADGSSDRVFIPILNWLLIKLGIDGAIQHEWANLGRLPNPPKSLDEKIAIGLELYPCDILFVHRDAEKKSRQTRLNEINQAIQKAKIKDFPVVCIIPIRMLEAWLLFDKQAIRKAAGNPCSKSKVHLPSLKMVENLPDPKKYLLELLRNASELQGRRLKQFKANERQTIHRLAEIITDFSPLYQLSAFQALERDLSDILKERGWL